MRPLGSKLLSLSLALAGVALVGSPADARPAEHDAAAPLVLGHRGASGHRPEHTLAAYQLAIDLGADYVEPDLVSTRDGVLVARHENEISGTTDVSARPEFAARKTTKVIDGVSVTGWFTEDFTLAELKTLRAKERLPQVRPGNTAYDGQFEVPTFDEVLDLVARESKKAHRRIGVYPETKHPTYFDSIGLSLEEPLVRELERHHLNRPRAKVFVQSFETTNLQELDEVLKVAIIQLVDNAGAPYDLVANGDPRTYADLVEPSGLAGVAAYADGVGVHKNLVINPTTLEQTTLVDDAHAKDLDVHIWTMRNENQFMAPGFRSGADPNAFGDVQREYLAFFDAGVDGVFSDYPDAAVAARAEWLEAAA